MEQLGGMRMPALLSDAQPMTGLQKRLFIWNRAESGRVSGENCTENWRCACRRRESWICMPALAPRKRKMHISQMTVRNSMPVWDFVRWEHFTGVVINLADGIIWSGWKKSLENIVWTRGGRFSHFRHRAVEGINRAVSHNGESDYPFCTAFGIGCALPVFICTGILICMHCQCMYPCYVISGQSLIKPWDMQPVTLRIHPET